MPFSSKAFELHEGNEAPKLARSNDVQNCGDGKHEIYIKIVEPWSAAKHYIAGSLEGLVGRLY